MGILLDGRIRRSHGRVIIFACLGGQYGELLVFRVVGNYCGCR